MLTSPLSRAILLSFVVAPVSALSQSIDAFALLESAGRVYRASTGMCADFKQVLSVPLLGDEIKGEGRLCARQPGLFSMRFTEPRGDVLLADGIWFWVYRPSSEPRQVLRAALTTGLRGVDFYSEFLDAPRDKYRAEYRGQDTITGNAVHRIALTPSHPAPYRSAVLWIESAVPLLRKVEITEENGSVRTVTLGAVDVSPRLGADAFRFTPPVGAQVITR
jgi:outer membrane lipoprotein-sorting protein